MRQPWANVHCSAREAGGGEQKTDLSFGQIEMCHIGISLVIHIVLPCIYISQAAFLRPAGGWAPVPAAFPTVVGGKGKPAGPERQWAGWGGSQGSSPGENSLGERQESDHQRVRRRRGVDRGICDLSSHLNFFTCLFLARLREIAERQELNNDSGSTKKKHLYEAATLLPSSSSAARKKVDLWSVCSASSNTSS